MAELENVINGLDEISQYFYDCYRNADGGTRACEKFHEWMCAVDEAEDAISLLKAKAGWISVKERLPEKSGQYLCWFGANKLAIGPAIASYVDKWKAFGLLETLEKYPNVTHWMPLPEPPKEET